LWNRCVNHMYTFMMKPKLECIARDKYYRKSRSIFAGNSPCWLPMHILLDGIKPYYVPGNMVLLGCDPVKAFWASWRKKSWYIYSDNVYYFDGEGGYWDFDGKTMESSIKRNHYQCLDAQIKDNLNSDENNKVTITASNAPDVHEALVACLKDVGDGIYQVPLTGAPTYPSAECLIESCVKKSSEGEEAALIDVKRFVNAVSACYIKDVKLDDKTLSFTFATPPNCNPFVDKYLKLVEDTSKKGTAVNGNAFIKLPFMPSGIPQTALLNTVTSYNAIIDPQPDGSVRVRTPEEVVKMIDEGKFQQLHFVPDDPDWTPPGCKLNSEQDKPAPHYEKGYPTKDRWGNWLPPGHFERGLGCVLELQSSGNMFAGPSATQNFTPDFLGFKYVNKPVQHLELRYDTLFGSLLYGDQLDVSTVVKWNVKRMGKLASWILNGGVFYEDILVPVMYELATLGYATNYKLVEQELENIVLDALPSRFDKLCFLAFSRLLNPDNEEENEKFVAERTPLIVKLQQQFEDINKDFLDDLAAMKKLPFKEWFAKAHDLMDSETTFNAYFGSWLVDAALGDEDTVLKLKQMAGSTHTPFLYKNLIQQFMSDMYNKKIDPTKPVKHQKWVEELIKVAKGKEAEVKLRKLRAGLQ